MHQAREVLVGPLKTFFIHTSNLCLFLCRKRTIALLALLLRRCCPEVVTLEFSHTFV